MLPSEIDVARHRSPDLPIEDFFWRRWSPRAMSGEPIAEHDLLRLFEAARWAPSSYNGQPWRFVYARRDGVHWDDFLALLVDFNRSWARTAAALIIAVSRRTFERNGKPARTHAFDCGAAWMSLALQGSAMGLVVHGMEGFDYDAAARLLALDDEHEVHAMIAVGREGEIGDLPAELREREQPSGRKPLAAIAAEGRLPSA